MGGHALLSESGPQGKNEERFRLAAAAAQSMVYDLEVQTLRVLEMAGVQELLGHAPGEVERTLQWWDEQIFPEDLARCRASFEKLQAGVEDSQVLRYRVRHRDGHLLWVEDRSTALRDGTGRLVRVVGSLVSIDAQVKAEEALKSEHELFRASTRRFELALESSRVVVFNQDLELRYTWIHNPALGFQVSEVLGKQDRDLFERRADAEMIEALKREVIRSGTGCRREVTVFANGAERRYDLRVEPLLDEATAITGVTCTAIDVTDQRAVEEALRAALQKAEAAVQARDEIMALVSHDLKSPLASLMMGVEVIRGHLQLSAELVHSDLQRMSRQISVLDRLIDELLDVARVRGGQALELERTRTNLVAVVRMLVEEHAQIFPYHRFEVTAPEVLEGWWDAQRLARVITNLLSNATKYSPRGGLVHLTLEQRPGPSGPVALLQVSDEGIGVPLADRPRIFDWYARGANVAHGLIRGLGIGLAGARQIVQQHGGAISVESEEGKGSVFVVELPLR